MGKMAGTSETRKAAIIAAEPQIFVRDLDAACRFWVEKLGFAIAFSYGEPPFYAQVVRDGGRVNLRRVGGPVFDSGFRDREVDALSAIVTLDNADLLFAEYESAGVPFHQTVRTEPWGARTFIVRDPEANLIAFAGPGSLSI